MKFLFGFVIAFVLFVFLWAFTANWKVIQATKVCWEQGYHTAAINIYTRETQCVYPVKCKTTE